MLSMEIVEISKGEDIITQGLKIKSMGLFIYITILPYRPRWRLLLRG